MVRPLMGKAEKGRESEVDQEVGTNVEPHLSVPPPLVPLLGEEGMGRAHERM